ncbi:alpha/beta hydrolase [Streptomyces sp. GESEQ-13]|uniref:alpha/beta hydrolase n=1 Tax=Streptomyces sp. GESEQ-13 TaxID=2812654 RepID=UPI001B322B6B
MHFTSEHPLDDGVLERRFTLDGIPGLLWTPASASASAPAPLILLGHPPLGLSTMYPRLVARARHAAADGFATATIELPGSGDRPSWPALNLAREDLRRTLRAGDPVNDDLVDALVLPLVDAAAPEWRAALDAVLALPEITGPVGISGGLISLAVRLTVTDPRIKAAGLFAGSFAPRATFEEARRVTIPLHVLLQWDDEGNNREASLALFDAFASTDKSLHAHLGGHTGVPASAADAAAGFFRRHLRAG